MLTERERSKVQLTDLAFKRIRRVWGTHHYRQQQCCLRGDDLYAIFNDGTINQFNRRGKRRTFATISEQIIEQTFADFERATGLSVCQGWHAEYPKPEDSSERDLLLRFFNWLLTYDSEADVFLASSNQLSHVVVCFESNGQLRWSKFLSPGCCSGPAKRVSNGLWATASGCSGVVNWLGSDGEFVHWVHGVGSSIEVIRDEIVVGSWDKLSAYDEGKPVWHLERPYSYAVSDSHLATVDEVDEEVEIVAYKV